jgi:hypothetical protein
MESGPKPAGSAGRAGKSRWISLMLWSISVGGEPSSATFDQFAVDSQEQTRLGKDKPLQQKSKMRFWDDFVESSFPFFAYLLSKRCKKTQ